MAEKVPIRAVYNGADTCGLSELQDGEVVGVEHGGLGACTLTTDGVLLGNTQGAVQVSSALTTNGQLLIGGTSGPAVANITGTANEVEITNADQSITIGLPATVSGLTYVSATCLGGTLQTAAQANVTSVGTLSSLTISGDVVIDTTSLKVDSSNNRVGIGTATPSHLLDVEGVANVATCIITPIYCVASQYVLPAADGSAGQVMCTDGSGGIAFATNTPSSPGGSDTYVQFNDGSSFGGSANFTWDDTTVKASNFCTAGTATLATVDINAGAIDGTTIGAASAAAITATTITGSGNASFDGGTFIFNESGADKDFRIEGDTAANLFITDASVDRIGIGTATPSHLLDIEGVGHASTCFVSADLCATTKVVAAAICMGGGYALPTSDGTAGYILCTDGSGAVSFAAAASSGHTIAEDGSTLTDRTCLNFCGAAVTVTDCSATDSTDVQIRATGACLPVRVTDGTQCYPCLVNATIAAPCLQCDTAPKLGGDLDVNGNSIISASNGNIPITPNGTGIVIIDGICHPIADGSAGQLLCTDGSASLKFATAASSGHTIAEEGSTLASRTCLNFIGTAVTATDNSGTDATDVTVCATSSLLGVRMAAGTACCITLSSAAVGESLVSDTTPQLGGNLDVNGQSIVSASNGNIPITPNGTGSVVISKLSVTGDTSLDGGSFVFNDSGADKDFRIEGDTATNLFIADASTDRIGIGTATPSHLLDVNGVANVSTCIVTPKLCIYPGGFSSGYVLPAADGSAGQIMCTDGSGALAFATAAAGFVSTDAHTWTADQTFNDNVKITLGTGGDADLYYDGTNAILNPKVAGSGIFKVAGDLGVGGTTSATNWPFTAELIVEGTYPGIFLKNTTADEDDWVIGTTGGTLYLNNDTDNDAGMSITEAGKVTLNSLISTGDVGIGTTAPDTTLHVFTGSAGTISTTTGMGLTVEDSDSGGIQIITPDSDAANIFFGSASYINNARITSEYNSGSQFLAFQTNATERMRLDSAGYMRMAGAGIQFNGDTSAANALDDYEEGTWTAYLCPGSGSIGLNAAYNTGSYTKIGRVVTLTGAFSVSSVSSPSGQVLICGMPFATGGSGDDYEYRSAGSISPWAFAGTINSWAPFVGADQIQMYIQDNGVNSEADHFQVNTEIRMEITYIT